MFYLANLDCQERRSVSENKILFYFDTVASISELILYGTKGGMGGTVVNH